MHLCIVYATETFTNYILNLNDITYITVSLSIAISKSSAELSGENFISPYVYDVPVL